MLTKSWRLSRSRQVTSQSKVINQVPEIIEPLTDREREILRLIAEGKSNGEISRRLYLALSTVKGHNLRIFAKLQVQSRTEAVARARELDLL
jgi:LuxR family maltose regulon positive regulatory protein